MKTLNILLGICLFILSVSFTTTIHADDKTGFENYKRHGIGVIYCEEEQCTVIATGLEKKHGPNLTFRYYGNGVYYFEYPRSKDLAYIATVDIAGWAIADFLKLVGRNVVMTTRCGVVGHIDTCNDLLIVVSDPKWSPEDALSVVDRQEKASKQFDDAFSKFGGRISKTATEKPDQNADEKGMRYGNPFEEDEEARKKEYDMMKDVCVGVQYPDDYRVCMQERGFTPEEIKKYGGKP